MLSGLSQKSLYARYGCGRMRSLLNLIPRMTIQHQPKLMGCLPSQCESLVELTLRSAPRAIPEASWRVSQATPAVKPTKPPTTPMATTEEVFGSLRWASRAQRAPNPAPITVGAQEARAERERIAPTGSPCRTVHMRYAHPAIRNQQDHAHTPLPTSSNRQFSLPSILIAT